MSQHDHRADGGNGVGVVLLGLFSIGAAIAVANIEWAAIYFTVLPIVVLPLLSIDVYILQPRRALRLPQGDSLHRDG